MAGTRSSARQAEKAASSSPASAKSVSGTKRKADEPSPTTKAKRGRPSKAAKEQKTLEEVIPNVNGKAADDAEMKDVEIEESSKDEKKANGVENGDAASKSNRTSATNDATNSTTDDVEKTTNDASGANGTGDVATKDGEDAQSESKAAGAADAFEQVKADEKDPGKTSKVSDETETHESDAAQVTEKAIEEDKKREDALPSNVLEKGIIYFFTRGRVSVDDPDSVQDLARSYFVMRPLPDGAKITDGAIQDLENNRLLALPKKVWPKSGKDRFMVFVEKAQTTNKVLKDEFYSGSEYSTQTVGTRQQPEVTPLGEGVYAITSTGGGQGTTHLAYMLTVPTTLGEVQKDVGLAEKGSFVLSLKNPEAPGPANAQLPQSPDFPKEFIEEFRGRGWMPLHPKHLDYANAQMLLIGENFDSSSNLDPAPKDEKDETKVTPGEELEKLEREDETRVENLRGDDTIFADLDISRKDYPAVKTTW